MKPTVRKFTEEEVEYLVSEGDIVQEIEGEDRRWLRGMTTVIRTDDNKLFALDWDQGLTENQENEYFDGEYEEVYEKVVFSAQREVWYVTAARLQGEPQGIESELESLRLVGDAEAVDNALGADTTTEIDNALDLLQKLTALDEVRNFSTVRQVAMDYLHTIRAAVNDK